MGNRLNVSHGAPQNQASLATGHPRTKRLSSLTGLEVKQFFSTSGRGRSIFLDIPLYRSSLTGLEVKQFFSTSGRGRSIFLDIPLYRSSLTGLEVKQFFSTSGR